MTSLILTLVFGASVVVASIVGLVNYPETTVVQVVKQTEYRHKGAGSTNLRYKIVRESDGILELEYGGSETRLLTRATFEENFEQIP